LAIFRKVYLTIFVTGPNAVKWESWGEGVQGNGTVFEVIFPFLHFFALRGGMVSCFCAEEF